MCAMKKNALIKTTMKDSFCRLFCVLILISNIFCDKELKLLGLLPLTGSGWTGGGACLPAVLLAIDDVNANPGILKGYKMTYEYIDTKCDQGIAVYKMVKELDNNPTYIMVLGGGCSTVSESTSQVSYLWNVTQLSYGSSSPVLSNRKRFPNFFRLALPDQKHINARLDLMRKYNWNKVATIHQAMEFFSVVMDKFVQEVQTRQNITIISQEIFEHDPLTRVQNLKDHDARIIITAMYEDRARLVLCAAYKVGLYGPKVVWVFSGWYSATFWRVNLDEVDCTLEQMELVVEGAFLTAHIFKNNVEERGVANITVSEMHERLYVHPQYDVKLKMFDHVAPQCYDHIWLSALALNCTIEKLEELGHSKTIDEFTYADGDINDIIYECMSHTELVGVSGRVQFKSSGDPDKIVQLQRIQGGKRILLGYYRQDLDPSYYQWVEGAIQWKDGIIPRDSTYIQYEEVAISTALYTAMSSAACLGILLAFSFFGFNIVYRENKVVKMSSPNINNILLLGCVMCYTTVFINTTETESTSICRARDYCFCLGFTVTFSSLFSKTWRVYRIFTNKKLLKRSIKDVQLLVIIIGLVVTVLMVLVVREVVAPHVIVVTHLDNEVYMIGNDAEVRPFVRECHVEYSGYFGLAIYIIEGALLSFGAFLAWETRNVKIEALNDSHQIGLCLYNVVILSAVGLTLSLLLNNQVVLMYGITSGCLIIGTTLTQLLLFVPKVHAVLNKIDVATTTDIPGTSSHSGVGTSIISNTTKPGI